MDRRSFLRRLGLTGFAASTSGLLVPRHLAAAPAPDASERKFLFIFNYGGWDTTTVVNPCFDNANVEMEDGAELGSEHGVPFTDHEDRPNVRTFFESHGDKLVIINGVEVRSVTHERCQLISMTGDASGTRDGWPAIIAANSTQDLLLPHLVVYGRAYTSDYTSKVVRVGNNGQLPDLLDGTALSQSGVNLETAFSSEVDALADQYLQDRVDLAREAVQAQRLRTFHEEYGGALSTLDALTAYGADIDLNPADAGCMRDLVEDCSTILDCFELGLSRCGLVQYEGWCARGFDTHADNHLQSWHHDILFEDLQTVLADLATRTSPSGAPLADEVTVVIMSEMGRTPSLNSGGGRDHWTYTSAMLVGAGVRGGQVIGETTDDFLGAPVDLVTGEATDSGTALQPKHLGATLLALADIDSTEALGQEVPAIEAALDL